MIKVYAFDAVYTDEHQDESDFEVRTPDLYTPRLYCPTCKAGGGSFQHACIPEAPTEEASALLARYPDTSRRFDCLKELMAAFDDDAPRDVIDALNDKVTACGALRPREFREVAEQIRAAMGLPAHRPIYPFISVGPPSALVSKPLKVDIATWGADWELPCVVLTERAAEMLDESGLTGMEIHPIKVLGPPGYRLYTMVVFGEGGSWAVAAGKPTPSRCPECLRPYSPDEEGAVGCTPDERKWDGSDFFYFDTGGPIYITEHAREWLENSGLRLAQPLEPLGEECDPPQPEPTADESEPTDPGLPSFIEWTMQHPEAFQHFDDFDALEENE